MNEMKVSEGGRVQQCIEQGQALMSSADQAALCAALPLETVAFDTALALTSAALRGNTRAQGLSLGDRCCLALAQSRGATALTADHAWSRLVQTDIGVEQIRPENTDA